MSSKTSPKRAYNSSRRKEGARQTRRQIVEAARDLFITRGYAGATLEAIAAQASVAVETVYASFGSKRAILSALIDVSVVGDERPVRLLEREGPQAVVHEADQHRQIAMFAAGITEIMHRMAPLFELMRAAAKTEPDIAELQRSILDSRLEGMMFFMRSLLQNGPLRDGLTPEAAGETVWALTSGEVFTLLTATRGWSEAAYTRWLTETLTRLLLP